jgi:hypothetical protein
MKRDRRFDELERVEERPRPRAGRIAVREAEPPYPPDEPDETAAGDVQPSALPDALLALCHRFGLEAWASGRDDRGVWAFGRALAHWLSRPTGAPRAEADPAAETVRMVTNLLIIIGAVTRPPERAGAAACQQAMAAVAAARHAIATGRGPVASFPAAARAMQRLVRVRGWARLSPQQQLLAEAMLELYLESLAAIDASPSAGVLLALAEAWLSVLHTLALPAGFDERILRATSWYLETYLSSAPSRPVPSPSTRTGRKAN